MIIGCDRMAQISLMENFKCKVLQWDCTAVPMNDPSGLLGQIDSTSRDMSEVRMQTI